MSDFLCVLAAVWGFLQNLYTELISRPFAALGNWLGNTKDALAAFQSIATIVALVCAGVWFLGQHQSSPKLNIEQRFSQRSYLGEHHGDGEILLSVQVWLANVGSVSDYLDPGKLFIDEVNPKARRLYCQQIVDTATAFDCDKPSVQRASPSVMGRLQRFMGLWSRPTSSSRWIEAGERDQAVAKEYRLSSSTKTIRISSIWSSGNGGYWKAIDYYDLVATSDHAANVPKK
jgi:hypothetical protein